MAEGKPLSRRDVLKIFGATVATAALTNPPVKYSTAEEQGNSTVPQLPTATPPPEIEQPPEKSVQECIRDINLFNRENSSHLMILGEDDVITFNKDQYDNIIDSWGGFNTFQLIFHEGFVDIPPLNQAMHLLNLPLHELYCDSSEVPAFLDFQLDKTIFRYRPTAAGDGYIVDEEEAEVRVSRIYYERTQREHEDNTAVATTEAEHGEPLPHNYILLEKAKIAQLDDDEHINVETMNESFAGGVARLIEENGEQIDSFSKDLYKYIRMGYNKNLAKITTADGLFPFNTNLTMVHPEELMDVFNLGPLGGYSKHSLIMQSALQALLPDGYSGSQMRSHHLQSYVDSKYDDALNGVEVKPEVISSPYSIHYGWEYTRISRTVSNKDLDALKTIIVVSTPNSALPPITDKPILEGMICCTTVNRDSEGNLYMPENRTHVVDQDRMFGLPDLTAVANIIMGATYNPEQVDLYTKYKQGLAVGTSLANLKMSALIGAVISQIFPDGTEYSYTEVMDTIYELCPKTQVSGIELRVPDVEKLKDFFSDEMEIPGIPAEHQTYAPYIVQNE